MISPELRAQIPSVLARTDPVALGRSNPHWERDLERVLRPGRHHHPRASVRWCEWEGRRYHPRRRRAGWSLIIAADAALGRKDFVRAQESAGVRGLGEGLDLCAQILEVI